MKKLFGLFFLFFVCYATGHFWKNHRSSPSKEFFFSDNGFFPVEYPSSYRPFVLVIEAREQGPLFAKTLRSIYLQAYENFRLVCVDLSSAENALSRDKMEEFFPEKREALSQVLIVRGKEGVSSFENLKIASTYCADEEIVVVLNEGEVLAHEWVLHRLNQYYSDPDLWFTFSCFREYPSYRLGSIDYRFPDLPLKTFLVRFFRSASESEIMEAAESHLQFIPEILMLLERNDHS